MSKYIWNSSVKEFLEATNSSILVGQLGGAFFRNFNEYPDIKQTNAWTSSLLYLANRLTNINCDNLQVILEYQLPFSGERIDAILIGDNNEGRSTALIIEFKGWGKAKKVSSYLVASDSGNQVHPDYQLSNYTGKLNYSHSSSESFNFVGVTVMYNLDKSKCDLSFKNPVFFKTEETNFENFILENFKGPAPASTINKFVNGRYTQNKKLFSAIRKHFEEIKVASHLVLAESGFGLSNEQLAIIEEIKTTIANNEKSTFLIQGSPGSGKTLLAIHLLINILSLNKKSLLGYRNNRLINSLRNIFETIDPGLGAAIKFYSVGPRIGSNGIAEQNFKASVPFDLIIYDEAQRMAKENIGYALQRAKVQVFFFDEKQILNGDEEGTFNNFREAANTLSINFKERYLNGYYRIVGGESYHSWIEKLISDDNSDNLNFSWTNLYDLQIKDSFDSFLSTIKDKALGNRIALIASFTESPGDLKNLQSKNNLRVGFPLYSEFQHYKNYDGKIFWLMDPKNDYVPFWVNGDSNKLEKCASIYGCQGFEADYIGLIWGRDFVIRSGKWCLGEACEDNVGSPSMKKIITEAKSGNIVRQKQAFDLLRNRYRIFLTRGMKGTYIYFEDNETKDYIAEKLKTTHNKNIAANGP